MNKTIRTILLGAAALTAVVARAEKYEMDGRMPVYSDSTGYGYEDRVPKAGEPFYFSVKVPDGNYRVVVELGDRKRAGVTTVRTENRRLMAENIATGKGKNRTVEMTIHKRTPRIDDKTSIALKDREKGDHHWDDKLTLEFTGERPAVKSVTVEPADTTVTTVYLCGNSTVCDYDEEPWASWGQMIPRWFGPEVAIANYAMGGLTVNSFLKQRRMDKIMTMLKPGDWVVAEFGHNDQKEKGPGTGAWYHYSYNLKRLADMARKKGAHVVFITPTRRRSFEADSATIADTHGDFPAAMRAVAEREGISVIDLQSMTKDFFEALGLEDSKRALVHYPAGTFAGQDKPLADNTHFNPYGAYEIAKMVVEAMKELGLPITEHLRDDWTGFDPKHPDDWRTFVWTPAQTTSVTKPDGN